MQTIGCAIGGVLLLANTIASSNGVARYIREKAWADLQNYSLIEPLGFISQQPPSLVVCSMKCWENQLKHVSLSPTHETGRIHVA